MNLKKSFLTAFVISLLITAIIAVFIFAFTQFGIIEIKILLTTIAIGMYSLAGLSTAFLREVDKFRDFTILAFAIYMISFLLTFFSIWNIISLDFIFKVVLSFIILSAAATHISVLLMMHSEHFWVKFSLMSTITSTVILSVFMLFVVLGNLDLTQNINFRITGVLAIFAVLGTIVTPVLNKLSSL